MSGAFQHVSFSGGAKAHTVELGGLRLQSLVRSLRTTDCKRTRSNSAMCALAPLKTMQRSDFRCTVIEIASPYIRTRSPCHDDAIP